MSPIGSNTGSGGNGASGTGQTVRDEFDPTAIGAEIKNPEEEAGAKSVAGEYEKTAIGVTQGECIVSLAEKHGHFWKTIWNHEDNYEARSRRKNANVLMPDDRVRIPTPTVKEEDGATEQKHTFKLKNPPSVIRIKIMIAWEPFANEPYKLWLNKEDPPREGKTDAKGIIEEEIPPRQVWALLRVGPEIEQYEHVLQIGWLDPIDTLSGVVARLNNLGYAAGPIVNFGSSNIIPLGLRKSIRQFQVDHGLKPTSAFDQDTKDKLYELGI